MTTSVDTKAPIADAPAPPASATPSASAATAASGLDVARRALTWLFVPGDRPERFAKALASGAHAVIVDLEDAVDPAHKNAARDTVAEYLRGSGAAVFVRINDASTTHYEHDIEMLKSVLDAQPEHPTLHGVILPKAETADGVRALREALGDDLSVVAIIESALGLHRVHEVAAAGVDRLAFGAVDFIVDLGLGPDPRALDHARSVVTLASKVAGLPAPIDAPSLAIKDAEQLGRDAALSVTFGFGGKLCIHPGQVAAVAEAYRPSAAEVEWAQRVVAVSTAGASQLDGRMIDRPVIEQAQRVLERANPQGMS